MALHTTPGCVQAANATQTGKSTITDCSTQQGVPGCVVQEQKPASYGTAFNAAGGGVFATQIDVSGIFIWFFSVRPRVCFASEILMTVDDSALTYQRTCEVPRRLHRSILLLGVRLQPRGRRPAARLKTISPRNKSSWTSHFVVTCKTLSASSCYQLLIPPSRSATPVYNQTCPPPTKNCVSPCSPTPSPHA